MKHNICKDEVMCYDLYTGKCFYSNIAKLDRAMNFVNRDILNYGICPLSNLYSYLDKEDLDVWNMVVWTTKQYDQSKDGLYIVYHYEKSKDGSLVLIFSYSIDPVCIFDLEV